MKIEIPLNFKSQDEQVYNILLYLRFWVIISFPLCLIYISHNTKFIIHDFFSFFSFWLSTFLILLIYLNIANRYH